MGHTSTTRSDEIAYYKFFLENPESMTDEARTWIDAFEKEFEIYDLTFNQIKTEIEEGKERIYIIVLEAVDAASETMYNLESIFHEIDFHLIHKLNDPEHDSGGGIKDHKVAFDYERLTDEQKQIIDIGNSLEGNKAPEGSPARNLYILIRETLKGQEDEIRKEDGVN